MKRRDEIEVTIDDFEAGEKLLSRLGYGRDLAFEKRRESWELDDCRIELDELPAGLGTFVEIEGPDSDVVMRLRERLGLKDRSLIKQSYIAMVAAELRRRGSKQKQITF